VVPVSDGVSFPSSSLTFLAVTAAAAAAAVMVV